MGVFTPQRPHVAPMGVKFDVEEETEGSLLHAKFHPIGEPIGPPKLILLLRFDQNVEYKLKRPHGGVSLARFSRILQNL